MTKPQLKELTEKLKDIEQENIESAKTNALRYVIDGDTVAHREAITSDTAAKSYSAVLALITDITEGKN